MRGASSEDNLGASLDQIVLISNSVPKSGSTLLFNLQCEFFKSLSGHEMDYSQIEAAGINLNGGFVDTRETVKLASFLASGEPRNGPWILKMHTPVYKPLLELFKNNRNIFMSLIVRDPIDVFLSARRNFNRSGEFKEFSEEQAGVTTVNNFFQEIYDTCVSAGAIRELPIVRYDDLLGDRFETVTASLPTELRAFIQGRHLRDMINENRVETLARHRRSRQLDGIEDNAGNKELKARLASAFFGFRRKLGYV